MVLWPICNVCVCVSWLRHFVFLHDPLMFVKMTWVGKTLNNNMNICLGPHGAYLSRSVRRLVNVDVGRFH